jgi:integrase
MSLTLTKLGIDAAVAKASKGERLELVDDREPGLRIRAGERGAKWSVLTRTPDGGRIRIPLGAWPALGIAEARKVAQDAKRQVEQGINPNEMRRAVRDHTKLGELLTAYDKAKLVHLKRGAETRRSLDRALKKYLDRDPESITKRDIASVVDKLAETAPVSANRTLAYVRAFFAWAVGRGHLSQNPAANITKPTPEEPRERSPSLSELAEIWHAAGILGSPFGHALQLLIVTALRREEISGLRVDEIDLSDPENATLTLPSSRTKNGKAIRVPLPPLAICVLTDALGARPNVDEVGGNSLLVFSTTGVTPISGWSKAKARLDSLIAKARRNVAIEGGVEPDTMPAWRIHDLRRSFATLACDVLHIDPIVADRCLNHVGASTTSSISRVYGRSEMIDQRRAALNAWAKLLTTAVASSHRD